VREAEAADFRTMERVRLAKGGELTKLPRGGTADHETRSDTKESVQGRALRRQFASMSRTSSTTGSTRSPTMPVEMGRGGPAAAGPRVLDPEGERRAERRLVALFDNSTHKNTDTGAALAAATLKAGVTAIRKQKENGVNLNLKPTHLVVPTTLEFTARELVKSTVLIIAGTAGSVTERGNMNTLQYVGLNVVADAASTTA
jgi:hypothetical protein